MSTAFSCYWANCCKNRGGYQCIAMVYEQQLADTIARYGGYGVWMAALRGLDDSEPLKGGMLQLTDKVNAHFRWSACPQFLQLHTLKVCLPFKITGNHRKLICE